MQSTPTPILRLPNHSANNSETSLLHMLSNRQLAGQKTLAILLDPDKVEEAYLTDLIRQAESYGVSLFLVGGSLVTNYVLNELIALIRQRTTLPVLLFPGNSLHIEPSADAILLLSLISGRNAEFLIGQHVIAAPLLRQSNLEVIPTGYMLVDSGTQTTVSYISNTTPLPADKPDVAACTAMAGEMLGLRLMYLDAGSGAKRPISVEIIKAVRRSVAVPIVVGGGIDTAHKAQQAWQAGADLVVVGNGLEKNADLLPELGAVLQQLNQPELIC